MASKAGFRDAPSRRTAAAVYLISLAGSGAVLAAILLAPLLRGLRAEGAADLVYAVFSPMCHQIPDRCFLINGLPAAVCSRCLGIFAGFLAGLAAYPFARGFRRLELPPARTFILFTVPLAADGIGGLLGLWASPIGLRFATGLLWGSLLPYYFVPGVAAAVLERRARRSGHEEKDLDALENPPEKSIE